MVPPVVSPAAAGRTPINAAEAVVTFLASVGRRSEAELYLQLFRELPKHAFAIICPERAVLRRAKSTLLEQIDFLAELELPVLLALGVFDAVTERELPGLLDAWPEDHEPPIVHTHDEPDLVARLRDELNAERIPVLTFPGLGASPRRKVLLLGQIARELGTRKLVVLRRRGGVIVRDSAAKGGTKQLGLINLRSELADLAGSAGLASADRRLLELTNTLLFATPLPALSASVAAPFDLLRELFTVKGAGSLIKRGSDVRRFEQWSELDRERLTQLVEASFGRRLKPSFFLRPPKALYVEADYRGAAVLEAGEVGDYLTKFVVEPVAQGEGIGRDLWQVMVREHPRLFWRARRANPISGWYTQQCDGMIKVDKWQVFWRGIDASAIPAVVADALTRPEDLTDATP